MAKLTRLGRWSRSGRFYPHPGELLKSRLEPEETRRIAKYVRDTRWVVKSCLNMPWTDSLIEECHRIATTTAAELYVEDGDFLASVLCSDGTWIYSRDFAYYIEQGIGIPASFIRHVRAMNYTPPDAVIDYRLVNEDFGHYWLWWSLFHSHVTWRLGLRYLCFLLLYPWFLMLRPFMSMARQII
jgi:hypothetical protein